MTAAWELPHRAYDASYAAVFATGCKGTFLVTRDEGRGPALATCTDCKLVIGVPREALIIKPPVDRPGEGWGG